MLTFHAVYLNEYKKLLSEEIQRLMEIVLTNHAIVDFPAYKHQIGVIEGLKKALELSEEADAIANGRDEQGV
jgi:hypothetical protein